MKSDALLLDTAQITAANVITGFIKASDNAFALQLNAHTFYFIFLESC